MAEMDIKIKIFAIIFVLFICGSSLTAFENGLKAIVIIVISGASFYAAWYLNNTKTQKSTILQLRNEIENYRPGLWTRRDIGKGFKRPEKIRLGVFGVMSSGKSSLLNSFQFAFTGVWKVVFAEGQRTFTGGESLFREPVKLTDHVTLIDNRGLRDLSESHAEEVVAQIRGKRGMNPDVKRKGLKIDCPVFVFKYSAISGTEQCKPFLRKIMTEAKQLFGAYPIMVLTFAANITDRSVILEDIAIEGMDNRSVFFIENYTVENHEADVQRHFDLLEILRACIQRADDNIAFTFLKESEPKTNCLVM